MKTFTVRELDRSPGEVLATCRQEGKVRIRERGGQTYVIVPEAGVERTIRALPDFAARRAALGDKPWPKRSARLFDRLVAGE